MDGRGQADRWKIADMGAWIDVGVPIGATIIAAVGALGGVALGRRGERDSWLRDQRRSGYATFLEALSNFDEDNRFETLSELRQAQAILDLLGPHDVSRAAKRAWFESMELHRLQRERAAVALIKGQFDERTQSRTDFIAAAAGALGGSDEDERSRAQRQERNRARLESLTSRYGGID